MTANVSLRILFYIKRTKLLKNGEAPIYVKISIDKSNAEMGLNRSVDPELWNKEKGGVSGTTKEAIQLNKYLDIIKYQLREHYVKLREENKSISARRIKDSFLGIEEKEHTIVSIFQEHNDHMNELVNIDYSPETCQKYQACLNHTKEYIKWRYKRDDLMLTEIDYDFLVHFESFLKINKKNNHNTAIKFMTNFKKIIRIALANGWIRQDPYLKYKMILKKVDRGFLNDEELESIMNIKLSEGRLRLVRDCFIVSCFTGLAYGDLKNLKPENLVTGTDGKKWIKINRIKTNVKSGIPLLPVVKRIINFYEDHPACTEKGVLLPVLSNQKMNSYLKEIADLAGINKELTTHLARHTFATTVTLNNDVPIESVSKMLGHSSINMTKIYARLLDKKVGNDMNKIFEKYK